jgi:hypothetical protein
MLHSYLNLPHGKISDVNVDDLGMDEARVSNHLLRSVGI